MITVGPCWTNQIHNVCWFAKNALALLSSFASNILQISERASSVSLMIWLEMQEGLFPSFLPSLRYEADLSFCKATEWETKRECISLRLATPFSYISLLFPCFVFFISFWLIIHRIEKLHCLNPWRTNSCHILWLIFRT